MKPCKHPCCPDTGPCKKVRTPKKRKPIRKVSPKREKELRSYSTLRKQFLSANPNCVARLPGCTGVATEVHHKKGRIGLDLINIGNFAAVCRSCHSQIELHPVMAKELGLSHSRLKI